MPRNQKDATFDYATIMKAAGLVAASARATILDMGAARFDGRAILDITACESATGDEKYEVEVQLSNSATFASGVFIACSAKFGDSSVTGETADTAVPRRHVLAFMNELNGTTYRYVALYTRCAGTIATGINYSANLVPSD